MGVDPRSDFRIFVSFTTAVVMHLIVLWLLNSAIVKQMQAAKMITNVELLEIVEQPMIEQKKSIKPTDIWKMITKKIEKKSEPIKIMEDIVKKEKMQEMEKLTDKTEALKRKSDLPMEDLKKQRDQKLAELMEMTEGKKQSFENLIKQEATMIKDKAEPLQRDQGITLSEVGLKKAKDADKILQMEAQVKKKQGVRDMTHLAKLVDKKSRLKEMLMLKQQGAIELTDSKVERSGGSITQIVGTPKQRQVARELVEIQSALQEETDTRSLYEKLKQKEMLEKGAKIVREKPTEGLVKIEKTQAIESVSEKKSSALEKMKQLSTQKIKEVKKSPVEITGPLGDRKIVKAYIPDYPDWAKVKRIEADVSLQFYVNLIGKVMDDISIIRTSGYKELDNLCIDTLKKWVFVPLSKGSEQKEQWGIITFKFRLE